MCFFIALQFALHKLKLVKLCQEKLPSARNVQQKIKKCRLKQYSKNELKKSFRLTLTLKLEKIRDLEFCGSLVSATTYLAIIFT